MIYSRRVPTRTKPARATRGAQQPARPSRAAGLRGAVAPGLAARAAAQGGRDDRRADLLEAAYDLLAEKGFEGLRTRDVAARAGVNISTLHYYFGTKEALLLAVVARVGQDFAAQNPAGGNETLLEHLDAGWQSFRNDPRLGSLLQELTLRARRDPRGAVPLRALLAEWTGMIETILRSEVAAGRVRADLDLALGARMVTSLMMGATTQLGVDPRAFDFPEAARELVRWLAPGGA